MSRFALPLLLVVSISQSAISAPIDAESSSKQTSHAGFWDPIKSRFGDPAENPPLALGGTAAQAEEDLQSARENLLAGQVDQSLEHLKSAADTDPSLPPEVLMMAYIYLANNKWLEGKVALEQAAIHHRDHPEVYQACGQVALAEGRLADAWVHLLHARQLAMPSSWNEEKQRGFQAKCYAGLARVSERRNDWRTAAEMFRRWGSVAPLDANLFGRWGKALLFSGDKNAALEVLGRAHKLDPSMNPPELAIAALYTEIGNYEAAAAAYERAAENHPDDSRVYFEYAGSALLAGRDDEARRHLNKAIEIGSHYEKLQVDLPLLHGMISRSQGKFEDAERRFTHVLKQSPGHPVALAQLPLVLVEQEDDSSRQRALQMAMINAQKNPGSPQARASLGWVQYRMGQRAEAEETLNQAVALAGNNVDGETLYFLVQVMLANGKAQQAEPYVRMLQEAVRSPRLFILRDDARKWLDSVALAFGRGN